MATSNPNFLNAWGNERIRTTLLSHLDDSLCALRLTNSECCKHVTPVLFMRMYVTFTPSALTRPSRVEALGRIGHYIEHLTFSIPHSKETFLPPLIKRSGEGVTFHSVAESHRSKYGTQELEDILTRQYPPIFHAATNITAFIRAFQCMPKLRHLTIRCPGQDPKERYLRSAVDYALISLRIAVERANLLGLSKLSLSTHPAALLYIRSQPGFGTSPASSCCWKRIRKLKLVIDAWDFNGPSQGLDLLRIIDDYIRSFSTKLEEVSVTWKGLPGPCPFTLFTSPMFTAPRKAGKLFGEVTSRMAPLPARPTKGDMFFPKLRYMEIRNCLMSAGQVANLIYTHRHNVRGYDFRRVSLLDNGTWEEALEPLSVGGEWPSPQTDSGVGEAAHDSAIDMTEPGQCLHDHETQSNSVLTTKIKKRHRRKSKKDNAVPVMSLSEPPLPILQPKTFVPLANIQGVQHDTSLDISHQALADDVDKRTFTLKKAREAVLTRLGTQFSKQRNNSRENQKGLFNWKADTVGVGKGSQLVPLMIYR